MKITAILLLLTILDAAAADPSSVPANAPSGENKFVERKRIITDLDGDGRNDMILSGSPETFGNAGGPWTIYMNREGDFVEAGEIHAHPLAIAIEPDRDRNQKDPAARRFARVWVYLRAGGGSGSFGYYRVGEKVVEPLQKLELYLDNGATTIGKGVYDATFKSSVIPFTVERSSTSEGGKVSWQESKP